MDIEVLGCYGGELPGFGFSSFLINGQLLLDAGHTASILTYEEQVRIENVLIGHAHLDHVRDLPALIQNRIYCEGCKPLNVWALPEVIQELDLHMFNGDIWPDFREIPKEDPRLTLNPMHPFESKRFRGIEVTPLPARHTVPACGFVLEENGVAVLIGGDGEPTEEATDWLRGHAGLAACFIDTTVPNRFEEMAVTSGHLTPKLLADWVRRLARPEVLVYAYHLSPNLYDEITMELDALPIPVRVLGMGKRLVFESANGPVPDAVPAAEVEDLEDRHVTNQIWSQSSLFRGLEPIEINRLTELARVRVFEPGEVFIRQAEPNSSLMIIKEGRVQVYRNSGGKNVVLGDMKSGAFLGEISLFDPGPATASVAALDRVVVFELRKADLDEVFDNEPEIGMRLLRIVVTELCRRIRATDEKLSDAMVWEDQVGKH
ncbi:MAG: cyclic nucleotide-binding domain-containing protein [Verrucomicrobiota bacterium]|nr:cyclic nucleotide-binding domain-containing protein [Verrucomicrobiota bacterium]